MKTAFKTGITIFLLFLFLIIIIYQYNKNSKYKKDVENERIRQDSLMAVKQLLDKEIFTFQKKYDSLKEQNEKLAQQLSKVKSDKK